MGKVIIDLSVSLDGFIAGAGDGMDLPLGRGGEAVFAWMGAGPEANRLDDHIQPPDASMPVAREWYAEAGAMLSGRRTFDIARGWRFGHPIPVPIFVLTHQPPEAGAWSPAVTFVTDGLDRALELAQEAAGDRVVSVSGASIAQQLLRTGKVDEIQVSITPVLLTGGVRLFDDIGEEPITLEQIRVVESEGVTHLRYRVVKP